MMKFEKPQDGCTSRATERGQVSVFVLLALGLFLLGFVGFAVDMTNLWFHRQTAQAASDAACQAGIMDVLEKDLGVPLPNGGAGFTPGTAFDCSGAAAATPCWYASHNGYPATGLLANADSTAVAVSFPASNPAVPPCSGTVITNCLPPPTIAPFPLLQVDLTDRFKLTFASLISGQRTLDVKAKSVCAVVLSNVPVPIIIMNQVCPYTLNSSGSGGIAVLGGPPLSIQVNSSDPNAVPFTTGTIDLSKGGPNFDGSDLGTLGGYFDEPNSFLPQGTPSHWIYPHLPISDPFYALPVPARPGAPPIPAVDLTVSPLYVPTPIGIGMGWQVPYKAWGCPDRAGCAEYTPGLYTTAITVKQKTVIFDPGVYYITGTTTTGGNCPNMPNAGCFKPSGCRFSMVLDTQSIVRPSTYPGVGSNAIGGAMFYFTSDSGLGHYGSIFVGSSSGSPGARTVDEYGVTPPGNASSLVKCFGGGAIDPNVPLPSTMSGNVFLAPCTGPYGTNDTAGLAARGMLFWDDRDNGDLGGQPSMQGGGSMVLGGAMYFHHCASKDGAHLGTNCKSATNPPGSGGYQGFFQLQGSSGSTSYVIGLLITDALATGGGGSFKLALNPSLAYQILKAEMVQ